MTAPAVASPLAEPEAGRSADRTLGVPLVWLAAALLGLLVIDNASLLAFLGLPAPLCVALALLAMGVVVALTIRPRPTDDPAYGPAHGTAHGMGTISWPTLAGCLLAAFALMLLGGQGRLFYATPDWQIRDAVLADLVRNPWPFAYNLDGVAHILRAPLGMYLLPALVAKALPALVSPDAALLMSNGVRLGLVLAVGSAAITGTRARAICLTVFCLFSGWDALAMALLRPDMPFAAWDHIENWNSGLQYSATLTLAFWVPNHALAGWTCTAFYLLWLRGKLPVGLFAATVPLVAIWSPLAIMGAIPFALHTGVAALRRRGVGWPDLCLAAVACTIALPALIYQQTDAAALPMGFRPVPAMVWIAIQCFEVWPMAMLPLCSGRLDQRNRHALWLVLACLAAMPFWQIGIGSDFQMRASIMPLALLAVFLGEHVAAISAGRLLGRGDLAIAGIVLALGAATPALELYRAATRGPSPKPLCSLVGVWNRQSGLIAPYATYLAKADAFRALPVAIPVTAGHHEPAGCWDRDWARVRNADPKLSR